MQEGCRDTIAPTVASSAQGSSQRLDSGGAEASVNHAKCSVKLARIEAQWGEERFWFVDELWPLRHGMSQGDLVKLAERVRTNAEAHSKLAYYHLEAEGRFSAMLEELESLITTMGGDGHAH